MNNETKLQGFSITGCAKCDAKKLPFCFCSKSSSEEQDSEKKLSDLTEKTKGPNLKPQIHRAFTPCFQFNKISNLQEPMLLLSSAQREFQFVLKANVNLSDIKALLEQFIIELAHNDNVDMNRDDINIKELGKNFDIYVDDTQKNTLAITMKHPEHFIEFFNQLCKRELIVIKQDQVPKIGNIRREEDCQRFNPSPFNMKLTPY